MCHSKGLKTPPQTSRGGQVGPAVAVQHAWRLGSCRPCPQVSKRFRFGVSANSRRRRCPTSLGLEASGFRPGGGKYLMFFETSRLRRGKLQGRINTCHSSASMSLAQANLAFAFAAADIFRPSIWLYTMVVIGHVPVVCAVNETRIHSVLAACPRLVPCCACFAVPIARSCPVALRRLLMPEAMPLPRSMLCTGSSRACCGDRTFLKTPHVSSWGRTTGALDVCLGGTAVDLFHEESYTVMVFRGIQQHPPGVHGFVHRTMTTLLLRRYLLCGSAC